MPIGNTNSNPEFFAYNIETGRMTPIKRINFIYDDIDAMTYVFIEQFTEDTSYDDEILEIVPNNLDSE